MLDIKAAILQVRIACAPELPLPRTRAGLFSGSPAAFVVYLYLLGASTRARRDTIVASLQTIAAETGLSKSAVQIALRHLKRRGLLDAGVEATVTNPARRILQPWLR